MKKNTRKENCEEEEEEGEGEGDGEGEGEEEEEQEQEEVVEISFVAEESFAVGEVAIWDYIVANVAGKGAFLITQLK